MRRLDGITDSMDMNLSVSGVGDGQGSLVCCSPWGCKELDMTERLNLSELKLVFLLLFAKSPFFLHSLVTPSLTYAM